MACFTDAEPPLKQIYDINESQCTLVDENAHITRCEAVIEEDTIINFVTKQNLFCDPLKISLFGTAMLLGFLLGSIFLTSLSDIFGRKRVLAANVFVSTLLIPFMLLYSAEYTPTLVFTLLFGMTGACRYSVAYVYAVELAPTAQQGTHGVFCMLFDSASTVVLGVYYYFLKTWDSSMYFLVASQTLAVLYMLVRVPESPRWLLQKEEKDAFIKSIHSIATYNGCAGLIDFTQISQEYDETMGIFEGDRKTFGQGNVER